MSDYRYEDLVAEAETERAESEAAIVPGTEAIHDGVDMAAHFDAALTGGLQQTSVYNPEAAPKDSGDTDPSRSGGPSNWGY